MIKEIIKISEGNPPDVASDYSPEAALQVLRGPVWAVERGERRQKTPGKPNLLSSSPTHPGVATDYSPEAAPPGKPSPQPSSPAPLSSTKWNESCTNTVSSTTNFSPHSSPRSTSESSPNSLITPIYQSVDVRLRQDTRIQSSGDSRIVLTSLTSLEKTPKKTELKKPHYLPTCNIYNWKVLNKQEHPDRYNQQPIMRSKANWNLKLADSLDTSAEYDRTPFQSVKRLLMKSCLNPSSTQAQKKTRSVASVVLNMTSHDRKMLCSEQMCHRKVSRPSTVSFNSPTSSSALSNFPPVSTVISSNSSARSPVFPANSLTSHSASSESPTNHTTRSGWQKQFGLKGGHPNKDCYNFDDFEEEICEYQPLKRSKVDQHHVDIELIVDECINKAVARSEKKNICATDDLSSVVCADKELESIFRGVFGNITDGDAKERTTPDPSSESSIFARVLKKIEEEEPNCEEPNVSKLLAGQGRDLEAVFAKVLSEISPQKQTNKQPEQKKDTVTYALVEICSTSCPNKKCFQLPPKVLEEAKSKLLNLRKNQLHNFLLERLHLQEEFGLDVSCTFSLGKHQFCHSGLRHLFGISQYMLMTVIKEFKAGITQNIHGNKGNKYTVSKTDVCIAWIKHFSEVHCENLPDRMCLRLPSYLNIISLYTMYDEQTSEDLKVKMREFYKIFKTNFHDIKRVNIFLPRVIFLSANTHPVCNECATISNMRKCVKNESDRIYAESRKRLHMVNVRRKYLGFRNRMELAVRYPGDYLHVNIDDIDQKKIESPYSRQNTKEFQGMLRLNNHVTGVIITNGNLECDRTYQLYLNSDQFCQDSNKTITIMFEVLRHVQSKLGSLPRKLFIQSDNCSKDLKNQYVLSFYYTLVEMNVFEEIVITHLPVGHTHGDVDQFFSIIAERLRKLEIPSFEDLIQELKKIRVNGSGGFPVVKEMTSTTDFVAWLEPHLLKISGHTDFFQFKIRKEQEKTNLYVKESELDDDFKYPRGIKLFNSLPERFLMKVSPFRAESDYGAIFESVWNKYIPSLKFKYSEEEVNKIKQNWENRIKFLIDSRTENYEPFNILLLKKQLPGLNLSNVQRLDTTTPRPNPPSITAVFNELEMGDLIIEELKTDESIVFYCEAKSNRPWIGLLVEMVGEKQVKVQWLKKERKVYSLEYHRSGLPYTSVLDHSTMMFSDVLINMSGDCNRSGPYKIDEDVRVAIMEAYSERDNL